MQISLSLNEKQIFAALRAFLLEILPEGTDVQRSQQNRVAETKSENFVMMTQGALPRLRTNIDTFDPLIGSQKIEQAVMTTIQLDVHGPLGGDNSVIITTLFRDSFATQFFKNLGLGLAPLYTDDPRQMPFINGEQQMEDRWVFNAYLQANAIVTLSQDFFTSIDVNLIDVDVEYPPS